MATTNLVSRSLGDILNQTGNGTPDHTAPVGSIYTDQDNGDMYENLDGTGTGWERRNILTDALLTDIGNLQTDQHVAVTLNADAPTQESANLVGQELQLVQATVSTDGVMSSEDKTKLDGVESGATADQTDAEIETAYNNQVPAGTDAEITTGTETAVRRWSPQELNEAIASMAGGGLATKAGHEVTANFAGDPKTATVTFATAFADANYTVNTTAVVSVSNKSYVTQVLNKTASGFTITLGTGTTDELLGVDWIAVKHGES